MYVGMSAVPKETRREPSHSLGLHTASCRRASDSSLQGVGVRLSLLYRNWSSGAASTRNLFLVLPNRNFGFRRN